MCNIPRTEKIRALYSLFKLADRAKNLYEYRLANLTFGLAVVFLENDEFEIKYEDAGSPLSAYYDVVSICLADRILSIPVPLLNKDTLAECLKICVTKGKIIERLEHNRQHRVFEDPADFEKSFAVITSRYSRIIRKYFNDVGMIHTVLWALDLPKEQEQWCSEFLNNSLCQSLEVCV